MACCKHRLFKTCFMLSNRYILAYIAIFLMVNNAIGQRLNSLQNADKFIESIGITARCVDIMPFEFSYLKLTHKKGLGINIGYGQFNDKSSSVHRLVGTMNVSPFINHTGYFARWRFMPFLKPGIDKMSYTSFNLITAYNNYVIGVHYIDQIFGPNSFKDKHNFFSVAAEAEFGTFHELGKNVLFNYGFITGIKLYDPILFNLPGKMQMHYNYMPGAGFGRLFYFNFNVGLSYVL